MFKDFFRLSKLFFQIYWREILIWLVIQLFTLFYFRYRLSIDPLSPHPPLAPSNLLMVFLLGILGINYFILVTFLGNLFSSSQRNSWVRQLPFRASSLNLFPLGLISITGLSALFLVPWGAFTTGVSVSVIGIPIAAFLVLKNSTDFMTGRLKAIGIATLIGILWAFLFLNWSAHESQLYVEALAIAVFICVWSLLAKNERIYTVPISFLMISSLVSFLIYSENRTPKNFSEATLDYAFHGSEKTLNSFKKIALDQSYWQSLDQYRLPSYINSKSQIFVSQFSDNEKIQFINNIEMNRKKWADNENLKNLEFRPMRHSIFYEPVFGLPKEKYFPIAKENVSPEIEAHLYKEWKNSPFYCEILPFHKTNDYLDKIFFDENCMRQLFISPAWTQYSFFEHGPYEESFDQHLLYAYEKSPAKTKNKLMYFLENRWELDQQSEKYKALTFRIFNQEPLTTKLLEDAKADRFRRSLKAFKKLPRDKNNFYKSVNSPIFDIGGRDPFYFIYTYLIFDPDEWLNAKATQNISWLEALQIQLHNPTFSELGYFELWANQEIKNPVYWPQIEKLFKYVDERKDI